MEYFEEFNSKNTRNKNVTLKLPKIKIEFSKKAFIFQGAIIYNRLPIELRQEKHFDKFRASVNDFFK